MKIPQTPHNMRQTMPREVHLALLQVTGAIILTEYHMEYKANNDRINKATKTVYITFSNN